MEQIASFKVNHDKLEPGFYLSRKDEFWDIVSKQRNPVYIYTYDLRFKKPYVDPIMTLAELHSVEHVLATVARNMWPKATVYVGGMCCATGFYLVMSKEMLKSEIIELINNCLLLDYMPGNSTIECGHCYNLNLNLAKKVLYDYKQVLIQDNCPLEYPE